MPAADQPAIVLSAFPRRLQVIKSQQYGKESDV